MALAGLSFFYGLERAVRRSQEEMEKESEFQEFETSTGMGTFWIHISAFAVYNALIGYLLVHREEQGLISMLTFFFAMALHFLVNDHGLRDYHRDTYQKKGRWVLTFSVLVGWMVGLTTEITEGALGVLFAFLSGGIILNVLKEELPEERKSRFSSFLIGAVIYTAFLLLL